MQVSRYYAQSVGTANAIVYAGVKGPWCVRFGEHAEQETRGHFNHDSFVADGMGQSEAQAEAYRRNQSEGIHA
jgi:hypothetical protein